MVLRRRLVCTITNIPAIPGGDILLLGADLLASGSEFENWCVSVQIVAVPSKDTDAMDHDRFKGKWKLVSGVMRESWGRLISHPRLVDEGRRMQQAGRAQERYGLNKERAQQQLDEFLQRNRRWNVTGQ